MEPVFRVRRGGLDFDQDLVWGQNLRHRNGGDGGGYWLRRMDRDRSHFLRERHVRRLRSKSFNFYESSNGIENW